MARDHIALLADGHLAAGDAERFDALLAALEDLERDCAEVAILGDLFEVWLGVASEQPQVARLGRVLRRLRESGVRTVYVEGNRDFAIGRGATAGLFDAVARREIVERFGARSYHLSHGDLVNTRDRPYLLWRSLAKTMLAPAALRLLPDDWSLGLARRIESGMRSMNRRHKSYFSETTCLAWARAKVAAGADIVAVGHFHREVVLPVEAAGRSGLFVSLPFWHNEPRSVLFDREGRRAG